MLRIHELSSEERAVYDTLKPERIPEHVAIIMDGNGRWAGRRSLKRFLGHQQGAKSVQQVTETASRIGLPWLTLYAFSLENNLRRPRAEVNFLMRLLKVYLENNVQRMNDNNVRICYVGRVHELPREVQEQIIAKRLRFFDAHAGVELWSTIGTGGCLPRTREGDAAEKHQRGSHHRRRSAPASVHGTYARS